eukprot:403336615
MQLREAEEREQNQKKLYDRMFQAIEESGQLNSHRGSQSSRNQESMHNSQQSIGGRELDMLHKQVQEQLQEKISELEVHLSIKIAENTSLVQSEGELKAKYQKEVENYSEMKKEKDTQINRLERLLSDREYDVKQLQLRVINHEDEIKLLNQKIEEQESSYSQEYDKKFDDLKRMYSEQIDKQKKLYQFQSNDLDVIEQLRDELRKLAHEKIVQEEQIQRVESDLLKYKDKNRDLKIKRHDQDQTEKRLNQMLAERDKEFEREKGYNKLKVQKFENKLQKKKDKIRDMIFDFQQKDQEIEKMKDELNQLRDKIKSQNKKIKEERKSKQQLEIQQQLMHQQRSKSIMMNQDCDFEDCIDEECVEPCKSHQKDSNKSYNGCISASKKSVANSMSIKISGSPLPSDIRRSLKDVTYLTPNKSNRSHLINNHSQVMETKFQKMIDSCVKMECIGCRKLIPTQLFYDHITQTIPQCQNQPVLQTNRSQVLSGLINMKNVENQGNFRYNQSLCAGNTVSQSMILNHQNMSQSFLMNNQNNQSQLFGNMSDEDQMRQSSYPSFLHDKIMMNQLGDLANEINTERNNGRIIFLEEKLRKADELLRESAIEIKSLREEKDKWRLEFDRTKLLLEQTSTQLALVEEKKAENELEMKKEIKYLLESWLQQKNSNSNKSGMQDSTSLTQNHSLIMQKYMNLNNNHSNSNYSMPEGGYNCNYDQDEADVMMFPDIENSDDCNNISQIQLRGRGKHSANNNSVITNFNPLIALDTQDNPGFDGSQFVSQQYINPHSHYTSHVGTQRHNSNVPQTPHEQRMMIQQINMNQNNFNGLQQLYSHATSVSSGSFDDSQNSNNNFQMNSNKQDFDSSQNLHLRNATNNLNQMKQAQFYQTYLQQNNQFANENRQNKLNLVEQNQKALTSRPFETALILMSENSTPHSQTNKRQLNPVQQSQQYSMIQQAKLGDQNTQQQMYQTTQAQQNQQQLMQGLSQNSKQLSHSINLIQEAQKQYQQQQAAIQKQNKYQR